MAHNTYTQGFFRPKFPKKYIGDVNNIVYRSSLELKVMIRLDTNPNVIRWNSEETHIPYVSPIDNKIHRYFPDMIIEATGTDGKTKKIMIEIKPESQTVPPKDGKRKRKMTLLNEQRTYAVNMAKWDAAKRFCEDRGWEFQILTERDIDPVSLNGRDFVRARSYGRV